MNLPQLFAAVAVLDLNAETAQYLKKVAVHETLPLDIGTRP